MKLNSAQLLYLIGISASPALAILNACPTLTTTERCSTCPASACAVLEAVTVPCGCPSKVPTVTASDACTGTCRDQCVTEFAVTHVSSCSCPTVTSTVTATPCPEALPCVSPTCVKTVDDTVPCSCIHYDQPLPTTTVTVTGCRCTTGCVTTTVLRLPPCAVTPEPSPSLVTVVLDPPGKL